MENSGTYMEATRGKIYIHKFEDLYQLKKPSPTSRTNDIAYGLGEEGRHALQGIFSSTTKPPVRDVSSNVARM